MPWRRRALILETYSCESVPGSALFFVGARGEPGNEANADDFTNMPFYGIFCSSLWFHINIKLIQVEFPCG